MINLQPPPRRLRANSALTGTPCLIVRTPALSTGPQICSQRLAAVQLHTSRGFDFLCFLGARMSRTLITCATLALAASAAVPAFAQTADQYPAKPIRLVIPFPPGGGTDILSRVVANKLTEATHWTVVPENKAGAGGNIGAAEVARAKDDHTIGLMINGNMTIAKILNPAAPYDPLKDLAPLTLVGTSPLVLTAPVEQPGVPANADGKAFFAAAKLAGDKWSYGTPGIGTIGHLGTELLKARSGINPLHIPYNSYPQVATAMGGGQLQMAMLPPALAQSQAQAGKIRLIGVTSSGRSPLAPDVPSMAELGINLDLQMWNAFAAPVSMPEDIRNRLSNMLIEIARTPEVREKLFQQGWQMVGTSPQGLANRVKKDTEELSRLIKEQKISNQ